MNKKEVIALVRSDIRKHQEGKIDCMPPASEYAKRACLTLDAFENLLLTMTGKEQAYCYNRESNAED